MNSVRLDPIGAGQLFLPGNLTAHMQPPFPYCLAEQMEKTTESLYGIFVELTRLFWSEGGNFISKLPKDIRYSHDNKHTRVAIDAEHEFSDRYADPPFLIGIKLGAQTFTPAPGTTRDGLVNSNASGSTEQYSNRCGGTVTLRHIGLSPTNSVVMADETMDLFRAFSGVIRRDLGFDQLRVAGRVPLSELPVKWYGKERYTSDLTLEFQFLDSWSLHREAPKLREVIFNAGHNRSGRVIIPTTSQKPV